MLNYKQLYYFWHVARSGSVTQAAEQLHLTPQTISGQVAELEQSLGVALFNRVGRRLVLTAAGRQAQEQAGAIFSLGAELEHTLRHASEELTMQVGIADSVPRTLAFELLAPAMALATPLRLVCHEERAEQLFSELARHKLDMVLIDRPLPSRQRRARLQPRAGAQPVGAVCQTGAGGAGAGRLSPPRWRGCRCLSPERSRLLTIGCWPGIASRAFIPIWWGSLMTPP